MITPDNSKKFNNCGLYDCTRENGCNGQKNQGGSTRLRYDVCDYEKYLSQSIGTGQYRMYQGAYENCDKCIFDKQYWFPFSGEIIDIESELKNITRGSSRCPQFKYNPNCKKSPSCLSTFDPTAPIVLNSSICPIVYNNITRPTHSGLTWPTADFCKK